MSPEKPWLPAAGGSAFFGFFILYIFQELFDPAPDKRIFVAAGTLLQITAGEFPDFLVGGFLSTFDFLFRYFLFLPAGP